MEQKLFYEAVIKYFLTAYEYIVKKFPIMNDVLKHAEVANLNNIKIPDFTASNILYICLFPLPLERKSG